MATIWYIAGSPVPAPLVVPWRYCTGRNGLSDSKISVLLGIATSTHHTLLTITGKLATAGFAVTTVLFSPPKIRQWCFAAARGRVRADVLLAPIVERGDRPLMWSQR